MLKTFTAHTFYVSPTRFGRALSGLLTIIALGAQAQAVTFRSVYALGYPTAGTQSTGITTADINGDGKLDVLTANPGTSTVSVLRGAGDGSLPSTVTLATGSSSAPTTVVVADVNGDGKADIIASSLATVASILLGNGDGTFQPTKAATTPRASSIRNIAVADVNGDGKLDLLAANYDNNSAGVLLGNGDGTFQAMRTFSTGIASYPTTITTGDVNGDSKPDLLTIGSDTDGTAAVGILLGNGDGTFQTVTTRSTGGTSALSIAVGDVNGDGKLDVVAANSGNNTIGVLLGAGYGYFQPIQVVRSGGIQPEGVAVADVNNDGKLDLLATNFQSDQVGVLLGKGDGTFQPVLSFSTNGTEPLGIVVADVNGDRKLDILTANYSNTVSVLLNTTPLASRSALTNAVSVLTLYPNPTREICLLTLTASLPIGQAQVEVCNALGQVVRQLTMNTSSLLLPTTGLATGVYVVRLMTGNNTFVSRLVVGE